MATARHSWLFSDTVAGAKASAIVYSLVLTCRACNVEPYAYLHHVLTELPQRAPGADIGHLLPFFRALSEKSHHLARNLVAARLLLFSFFTSPFNTQATRQI